MSDETAGLDVLLVEDNPGDAKLVHHHLNSPSVSHFVDDVTLTHIGGLRELEDRSDPVGTDVVLLDLGLPESTGLATLDRATTLLADVPIIVLTGMDDRETAMEAIERGAQDYLPKGELDGDRLVRALRYAVVRSRQQRELHQKTEQIEFFNSILRHDILNGMNVIRSRSELLADELTGEQQTYADTVVTWSDNIIDLTRKVRSTLTTLTDDESPTLEAVELAPIISAEAERVEQMNGLASISVDCAPGERVRANELLGDVLGNVLTNAVDHTDEDVTITVSVTHERQRTQVSIADDGAGVPDAERDRIFERGQHGSESGGSGFGLYFVASMIRSYGGDVWVETAETGGAKFVIELDRVT